MDVTRHFEVIATFNRFPQRFFYVLVVGDVTERTFVEMLLAHVPKNQLSSLWKFSTALIQSTCEKDEDDLWAFLSRDRGKFYFNNDGNESATQCMQWLDDHRALRAQAFVI